MARALRIEYEGAVYHVTRWIIPRRDWRNTRKVNIFADRQNKPEFFKTMEHGKELRKRVESIQAEYLGVARISF